MDETFEGGMIGGQGGERRMTRAYGKERNVNVGKYERILDGVLGGALVMYGLKKRSLGGIVAAAGGGLLLYRGATGYCPVYERTGIDTSGAMPQKPIVVHRAITIDKPIGEVFAFWRNFKNHSKFMGFIENVEDRGDGTTHWVAHFGRFGAEWDSRVTDEQANRRIAWRSVEGTKLPNDGVVEFVEAPGGRGTEVHLRLRFLPPGRELAQLLAPIFRVTTKTKVAADLSRLKQLLETGEVSTSAMRREGEGSRFLGDENRSGSESGFGLGGGSRTGGGNYGTTGGGGYGGTSGGYGSGGGYGGTSGTGGTGSTGSLGGTGGGLGGTTSRSGDVGGMGGGTTRVPGETGTYGGGTDAGTGGGLLGSGGANSGISGSTTGENKKKKDKDEGKERH
jgi:uncharacterized membrane protein